MYLLPLIPTALNRLLKRDVDAQRLECEIAAVDRSEVAPLGHVVEVERVGARYVGI
jgi:formate-dependent phosphoribosylglycinamide formyltransferase (GAR transformylase)